MTLLIGEDSVLNEHGDNLAKTRGDLNVWSLEDTMEKEIERLLD
jgi:hypothetical protein